eukprot:gnl/TRDRNA2_/TRDRNA2_138396_c0_seq1.p1 gnl/TRDRNA2_/TRDRNA2_138396_c0~~gnl/TRDRNA2_/TRDRNA2_138396_c0_seq1.p1  ORF type:complete len:230 (-),score=58.76 gnl/TRDRNA2_/TRDRNA2_138396_c0_seq1:45-734(-)
MELGKLLQGMVDEAWGGGSGPPSVLDLHANTLSYKEKFVELGALMDFKSLEFTRAQIAAYTSVRAGIRHVVAQLFGTPEDALLHDLTFFSHINGSKNAQTLHDEYWHTHIDATQYGTFAYTTLLYFNTQRKDFEGGEFVFDDASGGEAVEPREGRLVIFSSGAENPHRVQKVTRGARMVLTAAFTCNEEKAAALPAFPRDGREGGRGGEGADSPEAAAAAAEKAEKAKE